MTNFEKALEIIDRVSTDDRMRGYMRGSLAFATVSEEDKEHFRGFTFALYLTEFITAEEKDILRMAMYEKIPETV